MNTVSLIVLPRSVSSTEDELCFYIEDNHVWNEDVKERINLDQISSDTEKELGRIMREYEEDDDPANFDNIGIRGLGNKLVEGLMPRGIRNYLDKVMQATPGETSPVLRIYSIGARADWIPWELMYIRPQFLGVHFQVARLPTLSISNGLLAPISSGVREVRSVVNLLGRDLLDPDQFDRWKTTFADVIGDPEHELRRPSAADAEAEYPSWSILDGSEVMPDVVHVTCHGNLGDESGFYWTLDHNSAESEYKMDQSIVSLIGAGLDFASTRPLIFGNACASARAGQAFQGKLLSSFGYEFYKFGASAFIGTFAPITKKLAVEFARLFYQKLFVDQLPVGEALRATKLHFHQQGQRGDPSWLFYCLYGLPETKYKAV